MTNPKQISIFIMIGVALFMIWYFFMREEKETVSVKLNGVKRKRIKGQQSLDFQESGLLPTPFEWHEKGNKFKIGQPFRVRSQKMYFHMWLDDYHNLAYFDKHSPEENEMGLFHLISVNVTNPHSNYWLEGLAKAQANDPRQQSLDFQKSVARPDSKKGYLDLIVKSYDRERSELERYKRDGDPIHTRNAQDWHKFGNQVVSAYKTNRATLRGQNRPFILY